MVTHDLLLRIPVRPAQLTASFVRPSSSRSIQGQSDEAPLIEGLVPLGLAQGGGSRHPRLLRVESLAEIGQRVIPKTASHRQGVAGPGTHQGLQAGEARTAQQPPHQQCPEQRASGNARLRSLIARRLKIAFELQTLRHVFAQATRRRPFHRGLAPRRKPPRRLLHDA